ncbi:MAG: MFS transporter [Kiritimatiellae bacterium]|nr:MFS transporter [Kiritimatiellia bacterium]
MTRRWIVLSAGILIQTILGGIYAWSTVTPWLEADYALSKGQCGFIFGMAIAVFTLVMVAAGHLLNRKGPRFTAVTGGVLFMGGYLLASFSKGSFPLLALSLGGMVGAGIGFSYVCPLSVGMKWFPGKKGLVTGAAVAGFGGGAILFSFVAGKVHHSGMDVLEFFRWFSLLSGPILIIASLFLTDPVVAKKTAVNCGLSAIWTLPFGVMLLCMFAGTFAGLLIVGNLAPLLMGGGMLANKARASVAIFSIGNAAGRILWGYVFDHLGYKTILLSLACMTLFCMFLLMPLSNWYLFFTVALLGFGFGSNFVIYAATVSRFYGDASFPTLYPICFLAYGLAGIIGPGLGGFLYDHTASYNAGLYLSIGVLSFSGLIATLCFRSSDWVYKKKDENNG